MATENEDTNELAYSSERLGLTPVARIALASGLSYVTGFVLGNAHGGRNAALRFRAENSHRLPTRQADWYRYHKAKHAYVLLASIKEGNRMGLRLVPWVALFYGIEEAVDNKFQRDFMSTTVAALAVSGSFSLWNKMPLPTAARIAKIGLVGGIGYGLTQDALCSMRGSPPWYLVRLGLLSDPNNDTERSLSTN